MFKDQMPLKSKHRSGGEHSTRRWGPVGQVGPTTVVLRCLGTGRPVVLPAIRAPPRSSDTLLSPMLAYISWLLARTGVWDKMSPPDFKAILTPEAIDQATGNISRRWTRVVGLVKTSLLTACAIAATNMRLLGVWSKRTGDITDPLCASDPEDHGPEELQPDLIASGTGNTSPPNAAWSAHRGTEPP